MHENGNHNTFTRTQDKWCKISNTPVHGDTLTGKEKNIIRMFFENVDDFVVPDKETNRCNKKHKQSYLNNLFGGSETR